MKWLWRLVGLLVASGLIAYFLWFTWQNLDLYAFAEAVKKPWTIAALLLAIACHVAVYPLTGMAWRQLLLRQGQSWRPGELTRLISLTQLAKYIPGNIAQHASRAALSLKRGMPMRPYVSSVVQETLLACAASIIVGVILFAPRLRASGLADYEWLLVILLIGSGVGVALFCVDLPYSSPGLTRNFAARLVQLIGGLPGPRATLVAVAIYAGNYMLIGLGIWLLAIALGMAHEINYATATSAFALSWILGFLAPGAPAGLGAREGLLVLILQGQGNNDHVTQIVLLARAASMGGDLLAFSLAAMYSNFAKPEKSGTK